MNDEQYFLANAYLDGELTADERAIAEADPDVMSEVEQLRALQGRLRDVEPPTDVARDAAIAAAMAEFSPVAVTPPPRAARATRAVPFRPRPAYSRYLAIAAAVVAVGVLGVVIVNGVDRGGSDDSVADFAVEQDEGDDAGDEAPVESALAERDMTEALDDDTAVADAPAAAEGADEFEAGVTVGEDSIAASDAGGEMGDDAALDADDMADAGDDGQADGRAIVPVERPVDASLLPEPTTLGERGADLLVLERAGDLPPTPNTDCTFPDADDPARILSRELFTVADDATTSLLVAVDEVNGVVYGIDEETCEILVEGVLR